LPGFETCESAGDGLWPTPQKADGDGGHKMPQGATATGRRTNGTKASVTLPGVLDMERDGRFRPLTSSAGAFLARTSVWRAGVRGLTALARGCGRSLPDSLASLAPDGSWPRTCQGYCQVTLDGTLESFSGTWPRSGTMRGGTVYPLRPLAPLTDVIACLSSPTVPTPVKYDATPGGPNNHYAGLGNAARTGRIAQLLPTVRAADAERGGRRDLLASVRGYEDRAGHGVKAMWLMPSQSDGLRSDFAPASLALRWDKHPNGNLAEMVAGRDRELGGQLNPTWVEWLMGFPLGWTDCGASATPSSRKSHT